MRAFYTISELVREFDITARTIRFYEDQGLLAPARQGRNRVYSRRDRARLKLTLRGKRLGFALSEIRELFELYDSAQNEKPQLMQFLLILEKRRTQLEQQRGEIDAMLAEIRASENQCRSVLHEIDRLSPSEVSGVRVT